MSRWLIPPCIRRRGLAFLVAVVLFGISDPCAFAQTPATITDLGTLGGSGALAFGINDNGDVVGYSSLSATDRANHAFLWRQGVMIDLGTLPGHTDSLAFGVNDHGQVVGYSFNYPGPDTQPFLWHDGVLTALPLLPGHRFGTAYAINNAGEAVGYSETRAVMWVNGNVIALDSGDATDSGARGINDRGEIVGYARGPATGPYAHAVIWEQGIMRYLGAPVLPRCTVGDCVLNLTSVANAISENGAVSGSAAGIDEITYAVRWVDGNGTALDPVSGAGWSETHVGSINDRGYVVGASSILRPEYGYIAAATLWTNDGAAHLLPMPDSASVPGSVAIAINDHGEAVGSASVGTESHAILWTLAPADTTPPRIAVVARGGHIWPPNGRLVLVTFTGLVIENGSGIDTVTFKVDDEYGRIQPSGSVTLSGSGRFTVRVNLEASRRGNDRDGRHYTLSVTATDKAGNRACATTVVSVPHNPR